MRLLIILAALLLVAAPVMAQPGVPPQGTLVIAVGVSDGMTLLPAGITAIAGIECGPTGEP